jgi:hypothetical protein
MRDREHFERIDITNDKISLKLNSAQKQNNILDDRFNIETLDSKQ